MCEEDPSSAQHSDNQKSDHGAEPEREEVKPSQGHTDSVAGFNPETEASQSGNDINSFDLFLDCEAVLSEAAAVEEAINAQKADAGDGEA